MRAALAFVIGATLAVQASAGSRLDPKAARERCLARTVLFDSSSIGPNGRQPSDYEIRAKYQRCFFGYTGQEATEVALRDRRTREITLVPRAGR